MKSLSGPRRKVKLPSIHKDLITPEVRGAKPRVTYVRKALVASSIAATLADFRHSVFGPQLMLHLRARGFAPLTRRCSILLFTRVIHTLVRSAQRDHALFRLVQGPEQPVQLPERHRSSDSGEGALLLHLP